MPVEVANGVSEPASLPNGDLKSLQNPNAKKNRDSERRRRRRKQKKNKKNAAAGDDSDTAADDADGTAGDSSKENSDPHKVFWTWMLSIFYLFFAELHNVFLLMISVYTYSETKELLNTMLQNKNMLDCGNSIFSSVEYLPSFSIM